MAATEAQLLRVEQCYNKLCDFVLAQKVYRVRDSVNFDVLDAEFYAACLAAGIPLAAGPDPEEWVEFAGHTKLGLVYETPPDQGDDSEFAGPPDYDDPRTRKVVPGLQLADYMVRLTLVAVIVDRMRKENAEPPATPFAIENGKWFRWRKNRTDRITGAKFEVIEHICEEWQKALEDAKYTPRTTRQEIQKNLFTAGGKDLQNYLPAINTELKEIGCTLSGRRGQPLEFADLPEGQSKGKI